MLGGLLGNTLGLQTEARFFLEHAWQPDSSSPPLNDMEAASALAQCYVAARYSQVAYLIPDRSNPAELQSTEAHYRQALAPYERTQFLRPTDEETAHQLGLIHYHLGNLFHGLAMALGIERSTFDQELDQHRVR